MFRKISLALLFGTFSLSAFADETKNPEFIFVQEANHQSYFDFQIGGGLLDGSGITGAKGSPIYALFRANYAVSLDTNFFMDLPMAGTISGGPDDFGIGNISIGGNHQFLTFEHGTAGLGVNVTFPSSQSGSTVGVFTRNAISFIDDQYAVSPYIDLHIMGDKVIAALDVGLNQQIFQNHPAGFDSAESILFYDAGLNVAVNGPKDFWATLEFGGYSTLTYANNDSEFFGGPGLRYQTDAFSIGLHFVVPFSSPATDNIDLMVLADTRFKF